MFPERADYLFGIAMRRLKRKTEAIAIGQSKSTINVLLGFGLFWEKIVPIIEEISKKVGCKYLYLFAADETQKENDKCYS